MSEFSRPVAVERIGAAPAEHRLEADAAERDAVARRLMVPGVGRLVCTYQLRRRAAGVIEATGQLEAEVTQICVVTLEEFAAPVAETFAIFFVPAGSESEDADPDLPDEIPYEGTAIDLGEAAAEQLALALDPYPKAPGATLAFEDDADPAPFAGLAALQRKQ